MVSTTTLTLAEAGGIERYTVLLRSPPTGTVTVTPESDDTDVATVSGALEFTPSNWNQPQTVTVTGVDDAIINAPPRTARVTHQVTGGGYDGITVPAVMVTATDDEATGVTAIAGTLLEADGVTPLGQDGLTVGEDGGTNTYQILLTSQPTSPITIAPRSSDNLYHRPRQAAHGGCDGDPQQ